jgi:hypothetical protein
MPAVVAVLLGFLLALGLYCFIFFVLLPSEITPDGVPPY